jgi:ubiquinone/menaquinone biosynthesis C-methylase UbiE
MGAQVTAIDPERGLVTKARRQLPAVFADRVHYRVGKAENLEFPSQSFDIVIFSWSF